MRKNLLDDDGENLAVRSFLSAYSCTATFSIAAMRTHMIRSGWSIEFCPEFARLEKTTGSLTKAGAQLWIRHLINMESE